MAPFASQSIQSQLLQTFEHWQIWQSLLNTAQSIQKLLSFDIHFWLFLTKSRNDISLKSSYKCLD
jgi:hypothetical protein